MFTCKTLLLYGKSHLAELPALKREGWRCGAVCPNSQYKRHLQNCIPSCLSLLKVV